MIYGFIGGGGGSVVLILIGLAILAVLLVLLFAFGISFTLSKRPKLAIPALLIPLLVFSYVYQIYAANAGLKDQEQEIIISVKISPDEEYSVTVDGKPNLENMILIDGQISFHIDFPDSRSLSGTCEYFQSRRIDGKFGSVEIGAINIPPEERQAFMASMEPTPKGKSYDAQTDFYTIWFRRPTPEFEWFTCASRINRP
jgi:hypothetical protein